MRSNASCIFVSIMFKPESRQLSIAVKDRKERLLRRRFISYVIRQNDSGAFELIDNYEELNRITRQYIKKQEILPLPATMSRFLQNASMAELENMCNSVRHELEQTGLKIFFDPSRDGELRPKWRYRVRSQTMTDYMLATPESRDAEDAYDENPNQVPYRIIQLVKRNYQYHMTPEWKIWFGRKVQRKREQIILDIIQKNIMRVQ